LIIQKGKVCAEDVKEAFNYKGLNAASQRLNKLHNLGKIKKNRSGQKVVYFL
jgi:hypothetical protein